jgi:glycosyltransferase involved in cell wall biosynthesis
LIITTYNRPDALELVLESALKQSFRDFEIIVADDGSKDETKKVIEKFQEKSDIKIIHSWQEDKGFRAAMARNKAVAKSKGKYLIFIDGDMVLDKDFVLDHLEVAKRGIFIQGSRVLLSKTLTQKILKTKEISFNLFQKGIKNRKNMIKSKILSKVFSKYTTSLKGIKTCNFALFREDFFRVNGFDNRFIGWGREDSEFAARLLNSGIKRKNLKFLAIAYHLWHQENSRDSLPQNDERLNKTIKNKLTWIEDGVDRFLKE